MQDRETIFVLDTNALWWYLKSPNRLSVAAGEVFRMAESGNATAIVPALVVAELHFLSIRANDPVPAKTLLEILASGEWARFNPLGRAQLEFLGHLSDIPEMHDKLIAAEAIIENAPLVTSDRILRASPSVVTIW